MSEIRVLPVKVNENLHLSYCTNIHRGETWDVLFPKLKEAVPEIKNVVSPNKKFGLGLRLSAVAAKALNDPGNLDQFKNWLNAENCYVYTLNGFPYGEFHQGSVKESVYQPDWQHSERLQYTKHLMHILSELLPNDVAYGSISTVPIAFKADFTDIGVVIQQLLEVVCESIKIREEKGKSIVLALEPEPGCVLETLFDTLTFFNDNLFSEASIKQLMKKMGMSYEQSEHHLRHSIGVCLDTCHASVMQESPLANYREIMGSGINIFKVQITAALEFAPTLETVQHLKEHFNDGVYLHQTVMKQPGNEQNFFLDIDVLWQTIQDNKGMLSQWYQGRTHFHVPIFVGDIPPFKTTQQDIIELLQSEVLDHSLHLEVETYTFGVLPKDLQLFDVKDNVIRELLWVLPFIERSVES